MKKPLAVLGGLLIALAPVIVLAATVYTLMLPNLYESSCRIAVQGRGEDGDCEAPCKHCAFTSPFFIRTQMEILTSKPVLYEVIKRLKLQKEWGQGREMLPREITYLILRNSVRISHLRDTAILEISVKRDNPDKAAEIANEIAVVFRESRKDEPRSGLQGGLRKTEVILAEQETRIEKADAKIKALLGGDKPIVGEDKKQLRVAIAELMAEQFIGNKLEQKKQEVIRELAVPSVSVEIIDVAEPNRRPVSPNLFMNVLLSVALAGLCALSGGIMLASGLRK